MRHRGLGIAAVVAALFGFASTASAVTYETEPAFCEGTVVRDYLAPLDRLPKLHSPPQSGQMSFGPASLRLQPSPSLLVGEGDVGYKLYLPARARSMHPDWDVTTTLSRIDWKGRVVGVLNRARRHLTTIRPARGAGVRFTVDDEPAPYRLTLVIRNKSGHKLGGYGFYFRLVAPTQNARLALNASSYRPGQTVFGRVENFGTEVVSYGVPYAIERLEGTAWVKAPESPDGPWILPRLSSGPGMAGECDGFWIPPTMPTGRYRMVKEINPGPRQPRGTAPTFLTAEFDVTP